MILLYDKNFEDLTKSAEERLTSLGISKSPGSIAKLLLNIVNTSFAELYDTLRVNHVQSFLSTATGSFVDEIGFLLNCKRLVDEKDEAYKYRITNQVLSLAKANETAIRLAALSVDGVVDVKLKPFSHGIGSFTVIVITKDSQADSGVLSAVQTLVSEVEGYGIKSTVANPELNEVKIKITLLLKDTLSDANKQSIKSTARVSVQDYLSSRAIGEPIIINELTQRIMEVNESIVTYTCDKFIINRKKANYVNQECRWNQRFILSSSSDAITIS